MKATPPMKTSRTPLLLAIMAAFALPVLAMPALAAPPAPPAAAGKAPLAPAAPDNWIIYDETTYSPVVDDIDRHLAAARAAIDAKNPKAAAAQLRKVSAELRAQSEAATGLEHVRAQDDASAAADQNKLAVQTTQRMAAAAVKIDATAAAVENGKVTTTAQLDKALDKDDRSDMDQRWVVSEVSTWYPLIQEPQRHFSLAVAAFGEKDYGLAAAEIRKGESYVRKEASRASGGARADLDDSAAQLGQLAKSVQTGSEQDAALLRRSFATAERALANGYRTLAQRSWALKQYDDAGHELRASAQSLESGADWLGAEARAGAAATVAGTRTLGDELSAGAGWTRDEVSKGMVKLGAGIEEMGRKINPKIAGG